MKWKFSTLLTILLLIAFFLPSAVHVYGQQSVNPENDPVSFEIPQSRYGIYKNGAAAAKPQNSPSKPATEGIGNETLTTVTNPLAGLGFDDSLSETGAFFIPADPGGAAGPNRLVAVVHAMIELRDKSGALLWRDSLRDFFSPLGLDTLGTFTFDPKVVYDEHQGRFVVVALERSDDPAASRILVAVSQTSSPISSTTSDWYYTAINSIVTLEGVDYWAEYTGLEVDEEAIYITTDAFAFGTGAYGGSRLWIIAKETGNGFYAGGPAAVTLADPYEFCAPTSCISTTTMPAQIHGALGAGATVGTYLVSYSGLNAGGDEYVQVIRVDDPLGIPTFVHQFINVGDIEDPLAAMVDAPQSGTSVLLETNDRRALDAVWRNNSLWMVATILPTAGVDTGQTTAHWWKLNTAGALITLSDQGNIGGEDIAVGTHTFFPAVAVNAAEDVCFGFSASAATTFVGAYAAARANADPAGTVQSSAVVKAGIDYYVRTFGGGSNRWGDQSSISVDPSNDSTFWVYNQFADQRGSLIFDEDGRWGTAWGICSTDQSAPTNTPTNIPVAPTDTPTNTPTNIPVAPTDTPTSTPVAPTDTPTHTPVVPTDTPTNTPVAPTDTPTNAPITPTSTPNPGKARIVIVKDSQPDNAQDYTFYSAFGSFKLDDTTQDDGDSFANSIVFNNINPGTYNFSESHTIGWSLTAINCSSANKTVVNFALKSVAITPAAGDIITCVFINQLRSAATATPTHTPAAVTATNTPVAPTPTPNAAKGSITIVKDSLPDSNQDFTYYTAFGTFKLDDASPDDGDGIAKSITFSNIAPGIYNFSEAHQAAWELVSIDCTPADRATVNLSQRNVAINLAAGDAVTCTFVNNRRVTINARKFNDLNGNGSQQGGEPFLANWGINLYNSQNALVVQATTDSNGLASFANRASGVYTVCEVSKAGWANTLPATIQPGLGWPCHTVTIASGQTADVLFGNKQGSLVLNSSHQWFDGVTFNTLADINEESTLESPQRVFLPLVNR